MKTSFKIGLTSLLAILMTCVSCGETPSEKPSIQPDDSTSSSAQESESVKPLPELNFDPNRKTEITFYHTMNGTLKSILDYSIEQFNEIYPNIIITNVSAGDYDGVEDQLVTSISAGKAICDMAYCYPDHVALYNKANSLAVLDRYIESEEFGFTKEQINDFVPAYWDEGKSFGDGQMYSLPLSKSTELMFYDKTFFEKEGLQVPTHWFPETPNVDDDKTSMEYVCKQIKSKYPNDYALGYDSSSNWFITLCEQLNSPYTSSTGEHYLFDNETNRDFVNKIKGWYEKGYVTTKAIYGQYTSNLFKNQDSSSSRAYMCIGSSAGAKNQVPDGRVFDVGVAKLPQMDLNNGKAISQGPNVCIFKNAKDPQKEMACWLLLRFLTTNIEFQAEFSMSSGYAPVINSVYENDIYNEFLDGANGGEFITAAAIKKSLEQTDWYFTSPAFVGSSEARDQVGTLLDSAMQGTLTIEKAFEAALNELRAM